MRCAHADQHQQEENQPIEADFGFSVACLSAKKSVHTEVSFIFG
jgi:hypothetical protein